MTSWCNTSCYRLTCLQVRHKALSLGEVLDGDRMAESLYNIRFKENTERQTLCKLTLSEKEVEMRILFTNVWDLILLVCTFIVCLFVPLELEIINKMNCLHI